MSYTFATLNGVTDWLAALAGVVGTLTGIGAFAHSIIKGRRTGATAAESVRVAREAATAAERSATEAARVANVAVDRNHRELRPALQTIRTEIAAARLHRDLFGTFTLDRDYCVRGVALIGQGEQNLSIPMLARAHQPIRFFIEKWPPNRHEPQAWTIGLRFWPPGRTDDAEHWTCDCGEPPAEHSDGGAGHWELQLPIAPPKQAQETLVAWR